MCNLPRLEVSLYMVHLCVKSPRKPPGQTGRWDDRDGWRAEGVRHIAEENWTTCSAASSVNSLVWTTRFKLVAAQAKTRKHSPRPLSRQCTDTSPTVAPSPSVTAYGSDSHRVEDARTTDMGTPLCISFRFIDGCSRAPHSSADAHRSIHTWQPAARLRRPSPWRRAAP